MAGFSRMYLIGGLGGYQGGDGINPVELQIWVGDADRQWVEPHYVKSSLRPLGGLKTMVPAGPNHPNLLIDACIAFYPIHFGGCPMLNQVIEELGSRTMLDLDREAGAVPSWAKLRDEARPLFRTLNIFQADLKQLPRSRK